MWKYVIGLIGLLGGVADIGSALNGKCSVRIVTFSTRIRSERVFTSTNDSFESIAAYEAGKRANLPRDSEHMMKFNQMKDKFANFSFDKTGGGTDVTSALLATKKLKKAPALVIIFTDGDFSGREYDALPELTQGVKVIWLLTTLDTSHIENDRYFDIIKYNTFASTGKVYNLNDYSTYITQV